MSVPQSAGFVAATTYFVQRGDHAVDESVITGFLGGEPMVTIAVSGNAINRSAGELSIQPVHQSLCVFEILRLDRHVDRGALHAGRTLVHQDPAVRQGVSLAG